MDDIDGSKWSCDEIGDRTPGRIPKLSPRRPAPRWLHEVCSGSGEDCTQTRCCQDKNAVCYQKHQYYGVCKPMCSKDDIGGNWTCKEWGPRTPKPYGTPTLFCYSVSRSFGYEPRILKEQQRMGAGIFACDETVVLSDHPLVLLDGLRAIHFPTASVGISKDGTAGNALLFMHVWSVVMKDQRFQHLDWTIKADPDAVLVPHRLRHHVAPHTGKSVYIKDCGKYSSPGWPMMFGAVEAISRQAMLSYFAHEGECRRDLPWQTWGEDIFMMHCLDHLGDQGVFDPNLVIDGVCQGVSNCWNANAAAFHPFKSVKEWVGCWIQTNQGIPR
jgi:hypothetical protein